jgi:glycosyltransferase involved in cell wall biosynthesis
MERSEVRPKLISVIVPALDAAATLAAQLAALAGQDYDGDWELLVVDNGSRDRTVEIVSSWATRVPRVRIIDASSRRGTSYARNCGARAAPGDLLVFCDADDIVHRGWLGAFAAAAARADVVAGVFDEESLNDEVTRSWIGKAPRNRPVPKHLGFLPVARGSNLAIRSHVLEQLGGFDESYAYGDDAVMSWRAQLRGFTFAVAEDAVVSYRFRTSLRSVARQGYAAGQSDAHLYCDFRDDGLPRPSLRRSLKGWAWLIIRLPWALFSRHWRGRWARGLGYRLGRAVGTLRYRAFAP